MAKAISKTFMSGNSEAVRLPRGIGFGAGTEVTIERRGDEIVIRSADPKKLTLREVALQLLKMGPAPGGTQERPGRDWPDRPGLND